MRTAFALRGEGSDTIELDIYDAVGMGGWFDEGVTARSVRRALKANASAKTIKVRLNSEGGAVFEGFAIYRLLADHPARVEVDVDAVAASVASVIMMAADEIRIASNAFVMVHNAFGGAFGEPDDLRRWADVLDKMSAQAAEIYAARTGLDVDRVVELMKAETWMTAAEAKELGFVDKITPAKKANQQARARAFASLHIDDFTNVPDGVRELVAAARAQRQLEINPDPGGPETEAPASPGKETHMSEENKPSKDDSAKALLATLGVATPLELSGRMGLLAKCEQLTGKGGDELLGVLQAWKQSHEELPGKVAELAKIRAETDAAQLDAALQKAKDDKRHTPAREEKVRKLLADKEVSNAGAVAMITEWGVVAPLAATAQSAAASGSNGNAGVGTHNGKKFSELSGPELAALRRDDPELYAQLRDGGKR